MKNLYVKDIINVCNGELFSGNIDEVIDNFSKDTRNINKNDIYIGIKGENFDGNLFYEDAFKKGAKGAILEKNSINKNNLKEFNDKIIILVDNSIKAIQKLAAYKRSLYDIPVIAITGSVGKTSTKDMIYSVLKTEFKVLRTEGNLNNHIGLPMTILKLKDEDIMVLEMGMNNLGEISELSNIAKPNIAVITNIGTAHIGNLGSRENILKAKLEILDGMNKEGTLIINNDNDMLHNSLSKIKEKINTITIGIENKSDYNAKNIIDEIFESKFNINNNKINVKVGGKVFIYNSLVAFAVGKSLNMDESNILKGIENFKLSENRMERIVLKNITIINDTYNASYDSVVAAIDLISKTNYKRKILLLGDILELGEYSEEIHRNIGKYILTKDIDTVITVGKDSYYIKEELIKGNFDKNNIYNFNKEDETYEFLNNYLKDDDIILVKGSHGMKLINIINFLKKCKSE